MPWESKKRLEEENRRLRRELAHIKAHSALIDASQLPKCEGLTCVDCRKAVFQCDQIGGWHLLGCGKGRTCADYEPSAITPDAATRLQLLLRQ